MNWKHSLQITALALCATAASASATSLKSYHVGNSLTNDARVRGPLSELATAAGNQLDTDWHLHCGNPLNNIVANPDAFCVTQPLGSWESALAGESFDAITLQPHTGATLAQESNAFKQIVSAAHVNSPGIDVYLYQAYPDRDGAQNYQATWDATTQPSGSSQLSFQRNHLDWVYDQVAGPETTLIPVGEVLYNFDRLAREGGIAGFSSVEELYRDSRHLNNVGQYLAALTFNTVLFNQSPLDVYISSFDGNLSEGSPDRAITAELQNVIQQLVLDTTTQDARTGVIPEPSSLLLLGTLLPLAWRSRNTTRTSRKQA